MGSSKTVGWEDTYTQTHTQKRMKQNIPSATGTQTRLFYTKRMFNIDNKPTQFLTYV